MKSLLENNKYNMLDLRDYPIEEKAKMVISNIRVDNKFSIDNIKISDDDIKIIYDFLIESFFTKRLFYITNMLSESNFSSNAGEQRYVFKLEEVNNIDDISKHYPNSYFIWHSIRKSEDFYYFRCTIIDNKSNFRDEKINSILE